MSGTPANQPKAPALPQGKSASAPALPEVKREALQPIVPKETHKVAEFKHELPLTCCRIDPTGRFVFAGAEDLNIYRWDLTGPADQKKVTLTGHESWVRSFDFTPDGRLLFSGGFDDHVGIWRVRDAEPKPIHMLEAHKGWVRWVRVNNEGTLLATCGNDNLIKIWELNGDELPQLRHTLAGHERHVYSVDFHPDGKRLASFDLMGNIKEWDIDAGVELRTLDAKLMWGYDNTFAADMGGARDLRFSPDGSVLAAAGLTKVTNAFAGVHQPMILLVDWETGEQKEQLQDPAFKGLCWGVRFHPEGFILGVGAPQGGSKGAVWFFRPTVESVNKEKKEKDKDVEPTKPFHTVDLSHCGRGLDLTPDAQRCAVAQFDGFVRIYEMTADPNAKPADAKKKK